MFLAIVSLTWQRAGLGDFFFFSFAILEDENLNPNLIYYCGEKYRSFYVWRFFFIWN